LAGPWSLGLRTSIPMPLWNIDDHIMTFLHRGVVHYNTAERAVGKRVQDFLSEAARALTTL
jgi:hypothetical protein